MLASPRNSSFLSADAMGEPNQESNHASVRQGMKRVAMKCNPARLSPPSRTSKWYNTLEKQGAGIQWKRRKHIYLYSRSTMCIHPPTAAGPIEAKKQKKTPPNIEPLPLMSIHQVVYYTMLLSNSLLMPITRDIAMTRPVPVLAQDSPVNPNLLPP
jgi:hypothetical protein